MKPNNSNTKSILPLIVQNNHSRSPTNIQKDPKEKSENNNINTINMNKFPSIKSVSNSQEIKKEEKDTNTYIEDMKKGTYNILVCVRCRPLSSLEYQLSAYETIRIMDDKMVILMDPIEYNGPNTIFKNRSREQTYAFDFAFDKNTSQTTVFEKSTKFLIEGVVNGYNATVFAYGATGAGKTYTMLGKETNPGIMPLTLQELFTKVKQFKTEREYKLKFWYLEIYNENIRDLLRFMNQNNTNSNNINEENESLDLREDPIKGIVVSGITEINVNNSNDMLKILKRGNRNRTQEATGANETSSRSHAILQVAIEYKDKNSGIDFEVKYSKLSLIDLAGSERAAATQNRGIRLIEGANINRSLLTLGNCINALCDAMSKGIKKPYIPYRDSKLTRLLKDSLGGNARTVMIANVSPSINTFDDTYNTLKYANRAKNIKTVVTRNVLNAQYHISNYVNIINNLKNEIAQLKQQIIMKNKNSINETINSNSIDNNINNNKDKDKVNNNKNTMFKNEENYLENIKEIKELCKSQIAIKQKILATKNEINKLSELYEINKDISTINNGISYIIKQTDNTINNNISPKKEENLKNIDNNTNQILDNENEKGSKLNILKGKLEGLQKSLKADQNKYKEIDNLFDKIININNNKYNYSDIQNEIFNLIIKNSNYKIQLIENKYNIFLNKVKQDIRKDYIDELEKQIEYRDNIIKEFNINISNSKLSTLIKDLENLKKEYKGKMDKANISPNLPLFQLQNVNTSLQYNSSLTNPNNINADQSYGTLIGICSKRNLSQLRRKTNNNIISNKNNSNNKIPSNYNKVGNNQFGGLVKNSSCSKMNVKKFQKNNTINTNLNSNNPLVGGGHNNNKGNSPIPAPLSNKIFSKNNNNINILKRNTKSFVCNNNNNNSNKEIVNINFNSNKKKDREKRHKSAMGCLIINEHNNSYSNDDYYFFCNKNNNANYLSDRLMTVEQMPRFKKSDINNKINEKNLKRQKFLDRINADIKDLL